MDLTLPPTKSNIEVMATPLTELRKGVPDPRRLTREAARDPGVIKELIDGLTANQPRLKFGCAKALCLLSEQEPAALYPHFDLFVSLLDHENKILQWEAIFILSHLAGVDTEDKFEAVFDRYFAPVSGPVMITAANVIKGGARIAQSRPDWADRVATQVLRVSRARYQTAECRNVAIGHAITALGEMSGLLRQPAPVVHFVRRQLRNTRPATRAKAERFLRGLAVHAKTLEA